jgi:glyoxylate utilization-related uncharacterized protein
MVQMDVKIKYFSTKGTTPAELENDLMRRWILIDEAGTGRKTRFNQGVTMLRNGVSTLIFGDDNEEPREKFCMVARGEMGVIHEGIAERLKPLDCLYAPAHSTYQINAAGTEVTYLWVIAPSFSSNVDRSPHPSVLKPRIIRASELEPTEIFEDFPDQRTTYHVLTGENFSFGFVKRPTKAHGFLHTHDPQDYEEAFISIQGSVEITDTTGVSHVLEPYDSAYVPPFGGNMNRNAGPEECIYAYVESPAVAVKEVAVRGQ